MRTEFQSTSVIFFIIILVVATFWAPALFDGKTHFIGDAIGHGLPLLDVHSRALHGATNLLWSDGIYGGHPLHAEAQGAFAHPLNILFALLVPPLYGASLFHFVGMLFTAWGTFGLCRSLGASTGAAGFGALVAVFSSTMIGTHHNMTYGGTATWIPWVLWGMEVWFNKPTVPRAVLWCIACCLCILAGYMHLFHGAVIYMGLSLSARLFYAPERSRLLQWRHYLSTGALAVILCAGITAIQLIPLFELVGESHRRDGIGMLPGFEFLHVEFLRGLLFSTTQVRDDQVPIVPFVGSVLMTIAFLLAPIVRTSAKVKGHIVATFVLFQLGVGNASPIFTFLYSHNLVPGLHYFRLSWPYLVLVNVGMGVVAAAAIDGLVEALDNRPAGHARLRLMLVSVLVIATGAFALSLYDPVLSVWTLVTTGAALALVVMLALAQRQVFVPMVLFLLLAVEVVLQHSRDFQFGDVALLVPPPGRAQMTEQDDLNLYRTYFIPGVLLLYPLSDPRMPQLPEITHAALGIYPGLVGLMYDVPTLGGAFALPLYRRVLLESLIRRELEGEGGVAPPGLRVIDLLSLRYIFAYEPRSLPGFEASIHDPQSTWWFLKNNSAKPRIQTYTRTRTVSTPDEALRVLSNLKQDELVIETQDRAILPDDEATANDPDAIRWTLRTASAVNYVIDVDAAHSGWLFLADANFPGWQARVDGQPADIFSAQVLGKAVAIEQGRHTVEISFHSRSFHYGLVITIVSLLAAAGFVAVAWMRSAKADGSVG